MAFLGFACLLVACVLAGMSTAPLFNRFLPPERRQPVSGCIWIVVAVLLVWVGVASLFSVQPFDPNEPAWQADTTNMGE